MWTVHAARVKFCQNDRCNAYFDHGGSSGWLCKHGSMLVLSEVARVHSLTGVNRQHVGTTEPTAVPVHAHVYDTLHSVDLSDAAERVAPTLAEIARCAVLLSLKAGSYYTRGAYVDLDINNLQRFGAQCLL